MTLLEKEEGEEVILLPGDLVHQVAAEACQALQRLVEFVWNERGRKSAKAEALSNGVSVIDVALLSVGESLFESLDQARIKGVDLGLEGRKLGRGVEETSKVPPVEVSGFQPHQETIQMVVLYQTEDLPDQLLSAGEIIGYAEATPGFGAILEERAAVVFCPGYIDTQVKYFIHRHSFLSGLGWPWTPVPQQPRLVIRTFHQGGWGASCAAHEASLSGGTSCG